jgi:hypothetical protein
VMLNTRALIFIMSSESEGIRAGLVEAVRRKYSETGDGNT